MRVIPFKKLAKSFTDRHALTYKEAVRVMKKNKSLTKDISIARKHHKLGGWSK